MNLRICYDKSIEIQLFKELLQTKFLCLISIDDHPGNMPEGIMKDISTQRGEHT